MPHKILIVDDEVNLVEMMIMRLEANGYEAIGAYDGEEGLVKAKSEKPDAIILDIMMPKMDGYTFVKKLKSDKSIKDIPIIILTAKPHMKDLFEIEGIKDYIVKPFHPARLLEKIKRYVEP